MSGDAPPHSARWLSVGEIAVDFARGTGDAPPGRVALAAIPLLILVGQTGAGKSSTVEGLAARAEVCAILPDRRAVTDSIILPAMTGDPDSRVADRIERFRLTAAFRDRHPGGMGDVLAHLSVDGATMRGAGEQRAGGRWLIFDGVRGAAETAAAARLPQAVFAVLQAAPEIRVARLSLRGDPFDQATLTAGESVDPGTDHAQDPGAIDHPADTDYGQILEEQGVGSLVAPPTLARLARLLAKARADLAAVASAASIVVEESHHYNPAEALAVLHNHAPDRMIVVDTVENSVDDVVRKIAAGLPQAR